MADQPKIKDPNDVLEYQVNWSTWLATDTITASTWIMPTGITKDSDTFTNTVTTIWLSGGTAGTFYELVNRITTVGGRTRDFTCVIKVQER